MTTWHRSRVRMGILCAGLMASTAAFVAFAGSAVYAQRGAVAARGYITGTVQSTQGPEAGVWVIAETKDLPTNFIKIVVTDDSGRFVVPELPNASYSVW